MIFELSECEEIIGYKFKNSELFRACFTHSSYTNEHYGLKNNERLEFFGDAILDFLVTEYLMKKYPDEDEGMLTERRKQYVAKEPLTQVVFNLGLDKYIILGRGVDNSRDPNEKFYSSLYEAIVAGLYIDGGLPEAKKFIYRTLINDKILRKPSKNTNTKAKDVVIKDYKSALQEFMQKRKMGVPTYKSVSKTGPDNSPLFTESIYISGHEVAKGCGKSKKVAQQVCAKAVYDKLVADDARSAKKKLEKDLKKQQKPSLRVQKKPIKDNKTKGKR